MQQILLQEINVAHLGGTLVGATVRVQLRHAVSTHRSVMHRQESSLSRIQTLVDVRVIVLQERLEIVVLQVKVAGTSHG
jgi:predicted thioesterase